MRKSTSFKIFIILLLGLPLSSSLASILDLEDSPLFVTNTIKPNVFFLIDDSGSMDWEILTTRYWHFCAYDPKAGNKTSPSSSNCGWEITEDVHRSYGNNGYRYFEYLFQNSDNIYSDNCSGSSRNSIAACSSAGDADWRVYSDDMNVVYYNPTSEYIPWFGTCQNNGNACANANFDSARSNPREGESGYSNIKDLDGLFYEVWQDNKGYSGTRPQRGSNVNVTNTPNGKVDLWDSHIKIIINNSNIQVYKIEYNPNTSDLNKSETLEATLSNNSLCYNILGPKTLVSQIFNGDFTYDSTGETGCRTLTETKQNFANWYQYSRRRSMVAKGAVSSILDIFPNFRYGLTVLNQYGSLFVEMPANGNNDLTTHNSSLLDQLLKFNWPAQGTPLRRGLERVGKYYDSALSSHPTSPILEACQQNFTVLLTDGMWNGYSPYTVNVDSDGDGISSTIADIAHYYYKKDLSNLPNEVVPNANDPATWQHMVTFAVSFGASGNLIDTDGDGWPNPPLLESSNWGNPYSSEPAKIDDLWHGAFNSKGVYARAQNPSEVTDKLVYAFENITERVSSATSVAQNSTILQTNSEIYQSRFNSLSWTGELLAYQIDINGTIDTTPKWNAGCLLTGGECTFPVLSAAQNPGVNPNSRVIITKGFANNNNSGIPFRWPDDYTTIQENGELAQTIVDLLKNAPYDAKTTVPSEISVNQAYGSALINYLRGDRTNEASNNGTYTFRNRASILGDIVNSSPLYVASPNRFYPDSFETLPYSQFKSTYANRASIVYTGSNSGTLHGFDATNGNEVIAFVPGNREINENLHSLSKTTYTHKYFVDGTPNEGDVFLNNEWKTILTIPYRNGGQGLSVLNITDPSSFNENNASNIFLWEFSDKDDPDLGYIHGKAHIAKVKSNNYNGSRWAVIFANGYNNSKSDSSTSNTGKAALFILFLDGGLNGTWTPDIDYIKIPVGTTDVNSPNGLAEPFLVDTDGDYIVDYVYAGDLKGNLWKFDLRSNTPTQWKTAATTLFTAKHTTDGDQPITSSPVVNFHPLGPNYGLMVYFGTGKYLENSDNSASGSTTQSFYAIWDKLNGTKPNKTDLLQQKIIAESSTAIDTTGDSSTDTTYELRQTSSNNINWAESIPGGNQQHLGWYIDLILDGGANNYGERNVARPILRNNNIIFTTMQPSQSVCDFGGTSWLMELNAADGAALSSPPFDLNLDGVFDNHDYMLLTDIEGNNENQLVSPSGIKSTVGIAASPTVFMNQDKTKEVKVISGSTGIETVGENPGNSPVGRQNWRELQ